MKTTLVKVKYASRGLRTGYGRTHCPRSPRNDSTSGWGWQFCLALLNLLLLASSRAGRDGPRISSWGGPKISEKKISNTHLYSINKLSTKTNTQKSLFLNILRYNHLQQRQKDTKYYCFLIQSSVKKELDALSNLQNHL